MTNINAEIPFEVAKAGCGLAVHTPYSRLCARLMTAQKILPKLLATTPQRDLVDYTHDSLRRVC